MDEMSPLLSAQDLAPQLGRPDLRLFDIRGKWGSPPVALHDDYLAGHIPGAAFLDWTREFLQQDQPINLAPVASPEAAADSFERLGVSEGDHVVLYDDHHHMIAGRVWWAMRYHGFTRVQVLNGGWGHWSGQGLPTATEVPDRVAGSFKPVVQEDLRVDVETVVAEKDGRCGERWALRRKTGVAEKDGACLLDGRGSAGFAGDPKDPRSGHIPGAISLPFRAVLDEDTGLFLSEDALVSAFDAAAEGWRKTRVISSCGSGYAGSVLMLALAQLGVQSSLYDGSMAEWKQDPGREVAQSPRPD